MASGKHARSDPGGCASCSDLTFAIIGALSAAPTISFLRWRREKRSSDDSQIANVRRLLWAQLLLFPLLLAFAALMARGFGEFA
ncbi:MAG: DUF2214 family protein [Pseudomonadota bacterium]